SLHTSELRKKLTVIVGPDPSGEEALAVRVEVENARGVIALAAAFECFPEEAFYGFGGRRTGLDQRGRAFHSWVEEGLGSSTIPHTALGYFKKNRTQLFGEQASYYPQSLFVSSRGYGFFLENSEHARFHMASDKSHLWKVSVSSPSLRYVIAAGPHKKTVKTLSQINGRHHEPPAWAKGFLIQHRVVVNPLSRVKPENCAREVIEAIEGLGQHGLKPEGYLIESAGILSESQLGRILSLLKERGIRPMTYVRTFVAVDLLNTETPEVFEECLAKGLLPRKKNGEPAVYRYPLFPKWAGLDFTNPKTHEWWEKRLRALFDLGFEGFMHDFGEHIPVEARLADGRTGAQVHNLHAGLAAKLTWEVVQKYQKEHPGREIFYFTRNGFSGRPGAAAFEFSNFSGDFSQDWDGLTGLAAHIPDMLNRGIGGAYGYNLDIGGYFDAVTPQPTKELFIRWTQLATLTPFFRIHNSPTGKFLLPWSFDDEALHIFKDMLALRERARPYMDRLWKEAAATGLPLARPLWLEYPDDPHAKNVSDQFLLGPDVLVAPVVKKDARSRDVYFPEGSWVSPIDGKTYKGPGRHRVPAPLAVLPYFFREGAGRFSF
ncbi:MAG: TIM-barrel domain-containing protein, partial [Bdellovibrionota bacterium]